MAKQSKDMEGLRVFFFFFQNSIVSKSILGTTIAREKKWGNNTFSWLHHSRWHKKNNSRVAPLQLVQTIDLFLTTPSSLSHRELSSPLGLIVSLPPFTTKTSNPLLLHSPPPLHSPPLPFNNLRLAPYLPLLVLWILLWFGYYVRVRVYFVILGFSRTWIN